VLLHVLYLGCGVEELLEPLVWLVVLQVAHVANRSSQLALNLGRRSVVRVIRVSFSRKVEFLHKGCGLSRQRLWAILHVEDI